MQNKKKVYADDVNYFKTSTATPDSWIEKAKKEIIAVGGKIAGEAFGMDGDGKAAFRLDFVLEGSEFKIVFPVLEPRKSSDQLAAKRQAATMMYHDIKARCMLIKVFGARQRFADYLVLPDGTTVGDAINEELTELPRILMGSTAPQLVSGEIIK